MDDMDNRERPWSANADAEQAICSRRHTDRGQTARRLTSVMFVLTIILISGGAGFLICEKTRSSSGFRDSYSASQNLLCVACKEAGMALPGRVAQASTQEPLCCFSRADNQVAHTSFSSKAAQALEKKNNDRPCQKGSSSRPSAFLFLEHGKLTATSKALPWCPTTPYSEHTGHLSDSLEYKAKYGGLTVPESGVYRVYSQVTFRRLPNAAGPTLYIHCLSLVHAGEETSHDIICSQTTKMNVTDARILQPSFFQGEIMVKSGDTLFVNVSDFSSVYRSYKDNYFGLSKL